MFEEGWGGGSSIFYIFLKKQLTKMQVISILDKPQNFDKVDNDRPVTTALKFREKVSNIKKIHT